MRKILGAPLSRSAQVMLGAVPIVLLMILYGYLSYRRQLENPMDRLMPSFGQLGQGIREILTPSKRTGEVWLWVDTQASLWRLAKGMGSGVLAAVVLGSLAGISSTARALVQPWLMALSKVPPLALLPIVFIFLGVDEISKVVLIALGIAPTLASDITLSAAAVPRETVVKGYTLGASTTEVAIKVILPQILPRMMDSIRLTIGPAWIFLIAAEAISAESGLGYRIYVVQRQLAMNVILPYVIWIALLGVAMDYALLLLSRWLFPWARSGGQ